MPPAQMVNRARLRREILGAGGAAALAAFVYTNGGYAASTQEYAALAVWWILGFFAAVGLHGTGYRLTNGGRLSIALLAGLTVWTGISAFWANNAEAAYGSFIRLALYVGVLILAVTAGRICRRTTLVSALALALVAVVGAALAAQLFPHALGVTGGGSGVTSTARLSFPLGYWNGLAIFAALGYPLLIGLAATSRRAIGSAAALAPAPLLAAAIYLASSRGGIATALLAIAVVVFASRRRWRTLAAAVVAGGGSALGVLAVHAHGTGTHGYGAGLTLVACAVVTAGAAALVSTVGRRVTAPPPALGWLVSGGVLLAVVAAAVAAHPAAKLRAFKSVPPLAPTANPDFVSAHLLSSSGSGRWQFWTAALDEFRAHPLHGGGAGSFEPWWTQHRTIPLSVVDAHSAYLQALAELGIVGFVLLAGGLLVGLVAAFRSAWSVDAPDALGPALAACVLGFAFAACIDWVWELPGVAIIAIVALGLALTPGVPKGRAPYGGLTMARGGLAIAAVAVMVASVIPLLSHVHLHQSYADAGSGDFVAAERQALDAHALQPWAASPYTQLALVAEQRSDLGDAHRWIALAIARAPDDWRLHVISARIDTKRLQIRLARAELATVRRLNPLAPVPKKQG